MSQALTKLKQVWECLRAQHSSSEFAALIDKCVNMAFHEVMGTRADGTRGLVWELLDTDDVFIQSVLNRMKQHLYQAFKAYHARTRELPYAEYDRFMRAAGTCGYATHYQLLMNLPQETAEEHKRYSQPVAAPASFPTPETRLAELLARLRDIVDEFTRKARRTEAAPDEEARAGDAEDYASDDEEK